LPMALQEQGNHLQCLVRIIKMMTILYSMINLWE
jgi:hypothetical protein